MIWLMILVMCFQLRLLAYLLSTFYVCICMTHALHDCIYRWTYIFWRVYVYMFQISNPWKSLLLWPRLCDNIRKSVGLHWIYVCIHLWYLYVCIRLCREVSTSGHMFAYIHSCPHLCIYTCMHVRIYMHVRVYMYSCPPLCRICIVVHLV